MSQMNVRRALRASLAAALAAAIVTACGGSDDYDQPTTQPEPVTRTASLSGEQEVPANTSGATGTGTLTVDRTTRAVSGSVTLDGFTASAAHIHMADVGANGAVVVALTETAPNTWSVPAYTVLTADQFAAFEAGRLYFNAHSSAFAGGEIRGQIGVEVFRAALNGSQENPPVTTAASGAATLVLDPRTRMLTGSVTTSGVAGTAAHIHTGAAGSNGGVAIALAETAGGSGVWNVPANTTLSDAQVASLRSGGLYANVHSAAHAGGEIRGQLNRKIGNATLSGAQEVPANASAASGTGMLAVDPNTRALSGQVTTTGVVGTVAHIHAGAVGANGGVAVALSETSPGVWSVPANTVLTVDQYKAFQEGGLYFNVHSAAFPGGEIRGQITLN
jgi:hypothetical protein